MTVNHTQVPNEKQDKRETRKALERWMSLHMGRDIINLCSIGGRKGPNLNSISITHTLEVLDGIPKVGYSPPIQKSPCTHDTICDIWGLWQRHAFYSLVSLLVFLQKQRTNTTSVQLLHSFIPTWVVIRSRKYRAPTVAILWVALCK